MPFLRGVTLAEIDSVQLAIEPRREIWKQIGDELKPRHLADPFAASWAHTEGRGKLLQFGRG
jgi:hypothetical protein